MLIVGVGLGAAMQPLVLAVQNDISLRDMGAGTAASTFFRSLGGAVGVATLGALLSARLPSGSSSSINNPAGIKALPEAARNGPVQDLFTAALHPIFLVAGLVAASAVVVSLAPAGQGPEGRVAGRVEARGGRRRDGRAEMEAAASSLL